MATRTIKRTVKYVTQQPPSTTCVVSEDICPEHLTHLIEVQNNGIRISQYCPVCQNKQMTENFRGGE